MSEETKEDLADLAYREIVEIHDSMPNAKSIRIPRDRIRQLAEEWRAQRIELGKATSTRSPMELIDQIAQHQAAAHTKLLQLIAWQIRVQDGQLREMDEMRKKLDEMKEAPANGEAKAEDAPAAEAQAAG